MWNGGACPHGAPLQDHGASYPYRGTPLGDTRRPALRGDARQAQRGQHADPWHRTHTSTFCRPPSWPWPLRCTLIKPLARAVLLAGVAELEDRPGGAAEDAAAAGALAAVLAALVRIGD